MSKAEITGGTVHKMPMDLKARLLGDDIVLRFWESLTPLARNEFICWVENAKQIETRKRRIERTKQELLEGKRRPCCWVGCIHRKDKPMSPSQKWVVGKSSQ